MWPPTPKALSGEILAICEGCPKNKNGMCMAGYTGPVETTEHPVKYRCLVEHGTEGPLLSSFQLWRLPDGKGGYKTEKVFPPQRRGQ